MKSRELPVGWIGWAEVSKGIVDKVGQENIDRMVDEWYDRAPLFPGDNLGDTWREYPVPFNRRRGKS